MNHNLAPTRENLKKLGVLSPDDIFLLRKNKEDTKEKRREEVFTGKGRMNKVGPLKVVAYFGDAMGDFPNSEKENLGKSIFRSSSIGINTQDIERKLGETYPCFLK